MSVVEKQGQRKLYSDFRKIQKSTYSLYIINNDINKYIICILCYNEICFMTFNRCKLWIAACNRKELYTKNSVTLHSSYRVCKKHFTDAMFLNYEKTRLQPHAIPFSTENNIGTRAHTHTHTQNSKF